jgi:translation initiation factor IF-2
VAKTLRVHQLAKDLGVASREIVSKCQAEGLDQIKNHMSTVSIGLSESIREWFSKGEDVTSVEEAAAVDLETVQRQPRRAEHEAAADGDAGSDAPVETGVAVADGEAPPESPTINQEADGVDAAEAATLTVDSDQAAPPVSADEPVAEPVVVASAAVDELDQATATAPEAPAAEQVDATQAPESPATESDQADESEDGQPPQQAAAQAEEEAAEEKPEEPVAPAGPQVVPKPASLQGPRVVRIEAPEQVRAPRPRPAPSVSGEDIAARQAEGGEAGAGRGRRGKRGPGESEADSRHKGRSPRRSGSTDVGERIREWRDQDLIERRERLASATGQGFRVRRAAERRRQTTGSSGPSTVARKGDVEIQTPIILKDYCAAIGVPFNQVMKKIMDHSGQMMMINQSIDSEMAEMVAMDFGITVKLAEKKTAFEELKAEFEQRERKSPSSRPPIVAMLGHVDHGKTSLLDRLRHTDVAAGEAGGITQHIGASRIETPEGPVTFLDTPGHEAFTAMRARGAHLTDVVVLVVAADDGVMPQTIEAINHAKAAEVQIVVALNKIDLPGADVNKVFGQLAEHELTPAEWGGDTDVVKTSAQTGEGIDELLTHLSTLSELMELKADAKVPALGTVIESSMVEGQGAVARVPGSGRHAEGRPDRGLRPGLW